MILTQLLKRIYLSVSEYLEDAVSIDMLSCIQIVFFRGIDIIGAVPIITHANGNCLYNSILALMPSLVVSPIELRVRTIMELVTNYDQYIFNYTDNVGPLKDRWKDICKDYTHSDLYEVAALCNVLRCDIRSLYPRIDYDPVSSKIFF
jgi:hypothetical protein